MSLGANVDFQDYNSEVMDRLTMPNVLLNAPMDNSQIPESRFFSGDWESFRKLLESSPRKYKYDLILTSETIYNIDNQPKLLSLFDCCLETEGKIVLAAKVHYFGVGGGLRQFEEFLQKDGRWKVETVLKVDAGVKREILEISRKVQ